MGDPSILDFRVLISPGLHDSGPEHWQTRWQQLHPSFERVVQRHWDAPELPDWSDAVQRSLRRSAKPTLIVAHSFGCLAAVLATTAAPNVRGLLLVAPADPEVRRGGSAFLPARMRSALEPVRPTSASTLA